MTAKDQVDGVEGCERGIVDGSRPEMDRGAAQFMAGLQDFSFTITFQASDPVTRIFEEIGKELHAFSQALARGERVRKVHRAYRQRSLSRRRRRG